MPDQCLLISTGDPAGIGAEICIKTLAELGDKTRFKIVPVGNFEIIKEAAELAGLQTPLVNRESIDDIQDQESNREILDIPLTEEVPKARASAAAGRHTYRILEYCCQLCLLGRAVGVVTCPINKASLEMAGYGKQGHTELLAGLAGVASIETVFSVEKLKIFFLSRHLSLQEALAEITKDKVLRALISMNEAMKNLGTVQPRLGVPGLNPHSGEGGLFGNEEIEAIIPAVREARQQAIDVEGPIGADSIYHLGLQGRFDAILSLYHDQGHIASKTYGFYRTVTLTLGLPFVRTSVDHGTAFDIAWQGEGNPESLIRAVRLAEELLQAG